MTFDLGTNVTSGATLFIYLNQVTSGGFSFFSLIAFFTISFIISRNFGNTLAMSIASFSTILIGLGYYFLGLITLKIFFILLIMLVVAIIASVMSNKEN